MNRNTQQLYILYRDFAFKQTWYCIWTCTDVLGRLYLYRLVRLYLYRLGRLYLYVWQISERSPIAAMSHCSPINTRGACTRQRLAPKCGLFLTKESVYGRIIVDASGFLTPCIHWKVPRGPSVCVWTGFPGVMNWTLISLNSSTDELTLTGNWRCHHLVTFVQLVYNPSPLR